MVVLSSSWLQLTRLAKKNKQDRQWVRCLQLCVDLTDALVLGEAVCPADEAFVQRLHLCDDLRQWVQVSMGDTTLP